MKQQRRQSGARAAAASEKGQRKSAFWTGLMKEMRVGQSAETRERDGLTSEGTDDAG
jgi:hypothetical protein